MAGAAKRKASGIKKRNKPLTPKQRLALIAAIRASAQKRRGKGKSAVKRAAAGRVGAGKAGFRAVRRRRR